MIAKKPQQLFRKQERRMRRFVSTGLALGALIAPAAAADMAAYNKTPTTVFSWTGFYLGGDIAVASTTNNAEWSPLSTSGISFGVQQASGGTGGASFAGGGLAGYNRQFANAWIAGVEADWTGMKTGGALTETWLANAGGAVPTGFTTLSSELEWTASIRARLGYLVVPSLLAYGTAGAAWGNFQFRGSAANSASGYATGAALSDTETGWVASKTGNPAKKGFGEARDRGGIFGDAGRLHAKETALARVCGCKATES